MIELDECPSENEIVGFLEGGLSDPERGRIEAHCADCERCREGLAHGMQDAGAAIGSPDDSSGLLKTEIVSAILGVIDETEAAEAAVGKRIGRFELLAVQGCGQFGVVYRARDTQLGRLVAVKVMRLRRSHGQPVVETLFRTEAAAAARLQHPNIVTLHDHGEFEGAPYLILELLEGESLRSRLGRQPRLPTREALAIAIEVTRALVEAHAAGVVHRDIKPGNVFLCASGQTKVLDFGLAQLQSSAGATGPGEPIGAAARAGTPQYMAPELFEGQTADPCTDVYSVGVMLFEMLVGPPRAAGASFAVQITGAQLSPRLRRLLGRATASERADRFRTAGELLAALTLARNQLAARRHLGRRLGIAVAGIVVATTAIVAVRGPGPAERPAQPTVAVLGFDNRSGRRDTAWLSTALSEMLDADLASSPVVRVVSPERVSRARTDLAVLEGGPLEPGKLQELRRYLGVAYVVFGSYSPGGAEPGAQTRFDVRIQDAWGVVLDSFSETASDRALFDLAARIGRRLRIRLAGTAMPDDARMLRASMPTAPEAVRLYAEGLRRWRSSELIEARDLLARAVAAEPEFPLAHSAFSQVLHQLGEEARMREEARLAFELSTGVSDEERWMIEARYREAIDQWPQARELRRTIHRQFPDDLDQGLELADALQRHEELQESLAVITELRRLPPPWRDDPRIDLRELLAQTSSSARKALAISAADKARALGARWVLARERIQEAYAERDLGEIDRSLAAAEEAHAIAGSLGDREGASIALYEAGSTRALRGDPISVVIAMYDEALQLERELGNSDQVANMLGNIAFEYLVSGDPVQAALRLDEMEPLAKGFAVLYAARHRAMQWIEQGELARAFARLEQVRQGGKSRGFELKLLGDVLTAQGELPQARVRLEQYLARDWPPDDDLRVLGELAMTRLEVEEGQLPRAEARARDIIAICERTHNGSDLQTGQAMLARVLVAEHRFEEARPVAESALRLATHIGAMPEWIDARIALARALAGLQPRDLDAALAEAQAALARARERGLVGPAYEARLAAGEIGMQGHRADARAQLRALADEADPRGFVLIARKARAAAAAR